MKNYLPTAAFALIAFLTSASSFAAGKNAEKITTLDKGSIANVGNTTTAYNKNGAWVYSIEHFKADNLPKDIMDIVRNNYGSYYICGMEKVEQPGSDATFIVHMQNNTTIKTVQVSGNETKITEDFIKG